MFGHCKPNFLCFGFSAATRDTQGATAAAQGTPAPALARGPLPWECAPKPGINIKKYLGTLPPDPLLSTFNRPQDFYSFLQKYLKFSCGFHPQIPSYILPINIQQTQRFLLFSAQIFKIFLGASPPDPLISHSNNIQHLNIPPYPHSTNQRFLLILAQISKIFLGASL